MADLVHDASGPASSEPAGIAVQQANRSSSSDDRGKLRVFISYSRDDLKFADQLDDALKACGFECLIDRHGISGGEDCRLFYSSSLLCQSLGRRVGRQGYPRVA
jgi:hypothetical protein